MSDKYTREDVIIWPDDPRLKDAVGTKIYADDTPTGVLYKANNDKESFPLSSIRLGCLKPFTATFCYWPCIIIKKEPKKKYVPFDLSKKEDRDALMGKRIISKPENKKQKDLLVTCFFEFMDKDKIVKWVTVECLTSEELLERYTFDDGSPCGKEVE